MTDSTPTSLELQAAASVDFSRAMRFVRNAVAAWLFAVFLLLGSFTAAAWVKIDHIDAVVTSHNTELAKTLDAACILIRSDPKLPQTDCPPAVVKAKHT